MGYTIAQYGLKKVHCVRPSGESITLPSDFDNSFVESIDYFDDDQFARSIVDYFLGRQRLSVETNKMYLINNRHIMHDMIQAHYSDMGSKCSDYELAQYILFYMQAAVMFQDEAKVLDELRSFKQHFNNEFSKELEQSVNISISLLEVQNNLLNKDDIVFISDDAFRKYFASCKGILEEIQNDDSGTYDEWAKAIAAENLAYVCNLYSQNPDLDEEVKTGLYHKTIDYCNKSLVFMDRIETVSPSVENNDSSGIISVFKSYIYRHLFVSHNNLNSPDAREWAEKAVKERRQLIRVFDNNAVDSSIYTNFEMEYYLSLLEYLDFYGSDTIDRFDYIMYMKDIDDYISKVEKSDKVHAFIRSISTRRSKLKNTNPNI